MRIIMMAALLRFIVLGEIPGTNIQLGYNETLVVASIVVLLIVVNVMFLYQYRRSIKSKLSGLLLSDIELKTI